MQIQPFTRQWAVSVADKMVQWPRLHKTLLMVVMDAVLMVLAAILALYVRLGTFDIFGRPLLTIIVAALMLFLPLFFALGIYRAVNRFSGVRAMMELGRAVLLFGLGLAIFFAASRVNSVPRTVAIILPIIYFVLAAGARAVIRYVLVDMLRRVRFDGNQKRVLIYGAGIAGQQLLQLLRREPNFDIRAFVDDDKRLHRQRIDGLPVFYNDDLERIILRWGISDVLLAIPSVSRVRRAEIVAELQKYSVRVLTLPHLGALVDGKLSVADLRAIAIEDLLGRDPVQPNELLMGRTIAGKIVLVTGAGGSIGSELCRQIMAARPSKLILSEMSEFGLYAIEQELSEAARECGWEGTELIAEMGSLLNRPTVHRLMQRHRPDTVFHAAAYKHVPLVEANSIAGMRNNIFCTMNTALEAEAVGVSHFILISTDKAVRPTNVMGASKRVCELVLQGLASRKTDTRFAMVRFGNVLGSSGSVVPRFQQQISEGGPVTLTHKDITRYFMTIPEAAQLVIQSGGLAKGGEVYVLDMGESVRIVELARAMIRLSGLTERNDDEPNGDIEIVEVGLRPGEKLYEELLIGENPQATSHPRIMTATEHMIAWPDLERELAAMKECLDAGDDADARAHLRKLVPEYQPSEVVNTRAAGRV
jgi:FlaA1/EpsC-like NDP-sugar epimerase